MTLTELIQPLAQASRDAGAVIMDVYQSDDFDTEHKSDGSPVTRADKAAEDCIIPVLMQIAPSITIISEENSESHKVDAPEQFFLVDPLDGTKEFLAQDGKGSFTVNIALIQNNEPVLGIVYAPALDRLFVGCKDGPVFEEHDGKRTSISVRSIPQSGVTAVASKSHRDEVTNNWLAEQGIDTTVSIGSSLKFCLVAAGEADVYPRFVPTMEWDTGAGDAVLRAAGGQVITKDGNSLKYGKSEYRNTEFIAQSIYFSQNNNK